MRLPHWLPAVSTGVALLAAAPALAQTVCPIDSLVAQSKATVFGQVFTRRAHLDTTFQDGCGPAMVAYDLVAGTFSAEVDLTCGGGHASTSTWDDYTIAGLEPGTPVSFRIELDADLQVLRVPLQYKNVGGSAVLAAGSASTSMQSYNASRHEVLSLDVTRDAGTSFPVNVKLYQSAWIDGGRTRITGTLRFVGLPEGSRVESCQGFTGAVLPARPVSWGRLKSL